MDERRSIRLLWIAKAALLAVLIYAGFEVATSRLNLGRVLDPGTASGEPSTTERESASPEPREFPDYRAIVQRDLFREAADTASAQPGVNHSAPPESPASAEELGLRLIGALAGGPVASRAILQDAKSNATSSYRIGDTVAAATVEAIERDAVVLRYQGRPLVLKLRAGQTAGSGPKTEDGRQKADRQSQPSSVISPPSSGTSRAEYVAEVFHKATIEPYVKSERTEGLKITGLDQIPMAQKIGLRDGDVIQSVNGQQLTSKQKAFQVLMKARTQPRVDIQILRDGKSKDLSFEL
jgi:type II secretion system protein C